MTSRAYTFNELVALCQGMHPTLDMKARGALLAADNEEPEQDERLTCLHCNGSGEGRVSESRCTSCGGSGVERVITDDSGPDYDEWRKQQADVYLSETKVQRADRRALVEQIQHPLGAK